MGLLALFFIGLFCICLGLDIKPEEDHSIKLDIDVTNKDYMITFKKLDQLIARKNKMVKKFTTQMRQRDGVYFGVFSKDVLCEDKPGLNEAMMVIKRLRKIFNGAITNETMRLTKQKIQTFAKNNKDKKCKVGMEVNFKAL